EKGCQRLREVAPSPEEWEQVVVLIQLLELLEALTRIFSSSQHSLAASIGPQIVGLLAKLKDALPAARYNLPEVSYTTLCQFHSNLMMELGNRVEMSEKTGLAMALHPTFNNLLVYPDQVFRDRVLAKLRSEY
ncbi:hypothetical protein BGZ80_007826, partial [Entomortierella chlamydospora]